jgi:hypothetical protein
MRREPALILIVAQLACVTGCAAHRPIRPPGAEQLEVVHVRLPRGQQSGIPISGALVLTAAHGFFENQAVAAVEGIPMRVCMNNKCAGREDVPRLNDWVALGTLPLDALFSPNRIDPHIDVKPGDEVWIGGFPQSSFGPDFWDTPATVVSGRVVDFHSPNPLSQGLVWVEVNEMEFHGMSGGPAALATPNGPVVFGMFVSARIDVLGFFTGHRLFGIARLDERLSAAIGGRPPE